MQGNIANKSFCELLCNLYRERASGELILKHPPQEKRVFLERGQIVFAASNVTADRLGETLIRHGKLDRETLERFLQQPANQRLGRRLVEAQVINPRDLINYISLQLTEITLSLFSWKEGTYQLVEGEERAPEELKMKLSTAKIILEGIRAIEDFETIRRGIGAADLLILPTAAGRAKLQAIPFNSVEMSLLNLVKEPTDLLKLLVNCKDRPEKVLHGIYGLLAIGMLDQATEADAPAKMQASAEAAARGGSTLTGAYPQHTDSFRQTNTSSFPLTGSYPSASQISNQLHNANQRTGGVPVLTGMQANSGLLSEIDAMKQRIATRDVRVILGIRPENNINEVYDAYLKLVTRFHPDKFANTAQRADVEYIFTAVSESYNYVRANGIPTLQPPVNGTPAAGVMPPPVGVPNSGPPLVSPGYHNPSAGYSPYQYQPPMVAPTQPAANYPAYPPTPQYGQPPAQYGQPQTMPPGYGQAGYYPGTQPPNPLAQFGAGAQGPNIRAISDEVDFRQRGNANNNSTGAGNVERALSEMFDYFEDRRALLFASDSLSLLLKNKVPQVINTTDLAEKVVTWARNKSIAMNWPISSVMLRVIGLIKQAEKAKLLEDFEPTIFYPNFLQILGQNCPPGEIDELRRGLAAMQI